MCDSQSSIPDGHVLDLSGALFLVVAEHIVVETLILTDYFMQSDAMQFLRKRMSITINIVFVI